MQVKNLMQFLEQHDPEKEVSIVVKSIESGQEIATTYDIGYDVNEYDEPELKIQVETSFNLKTH